MYLLALGLQHGPCEHMCSWQFVLPCPALVLTPVPTFPLLLLLLPLQLLQVLQCSWPAGQAAVITGSSTAFAGSAVCVVSSSFSGAYRLTGTADGQVLLEETGPAPR